MEQQICQGPHDNKNYQKGWIDLYLDRLSIKFQCQYLIEVRVSRVGSIKYLFIYVCKRVDRATVIMLYGVQLDAEISHLYDA